MQPFSSGCTFRASSATLLMAVILLPMVASSKIDDVTTTPGAKGSQVVETVISRLEASCIFPDDKLFMRRLSVVESYDGLDAKTFRDGYYGGIWQVDENMFDVTQSPAANSYLLPYFNRIQVELGINWASVKWQDLTKALFSALGARLYIEYYSRNEAGGIPRSISAQADFWKRYYRPSGVITEFIDQVARLQTDCRYAIGPDIIFVLDGSGSIGVGEFDRIKQFVKDVVDAFEVGTSSNASRFGVIQYSTSARREFDLNTYSTKLEIQQAVDRILYMGGSTATDMALDEMRINGFSAANGARSDHPKIGIVMTDGISNNRQLTIAAAQRCHEAYITMFAIGIGSNTDMNELSAIASEPDCEHLLLLPFSDIDSLKYTMLKKLCDGYVDLGCELWQSYSHTMAYGGENVGGYVTLNECLNTCANNPNCHGVDYEWSSDPCWLFMRPVRLEDYFKSTHYAINRDCMDFPKPEGCYEWTEIAGQISRGAQQQPRLFTLSDCKETCQYDPRCVGLDYERYGDARCWLHLNADNLLPINTFPTNNADQHRLKRVC